MWRVLLIAGSLVGCAESPDLGAAGRPVINGTPTAVGRFPAVGALVIDFQPTCTGSLIAPNAVLTAGHCVDPMFIGDQLPGFTLALDANTVGPTDVIPALAAYGHPDFDLESGMGLGLGQWNDIGIVILASDVPEAELAILPSPEEAMAIEAGIELELVGYGLTNNETFEAGIKHDGVASLVEAGAYELFVAEPGQQQNCNGDSGGPAFASLGGLTRVVGTVSRSPDTNTTCDHGGIDTRVDAYLDWIHSLVDVPCGGLGESCEVCVGDTCEPGDGAGCGCRSSSGGAPAAGLVLLALIAITRRRRRG